MEDRLSDLTILGLRLEHLVQSVHQSDKPRTSRLPELFHQSPLTLSLGTSEVPGFRGCKQYVRYILSEGYIVFTF